MICKIVLKMATLLSLKSRYLKRLIKKADISFASYHTISPSLTSQEVATALRPFYFVVHPDLFWQFPKEKEINENSLKLLNAYLETVLHNGPAHPTSVTFFLRSTTNKFSTARNNIPFKTVNIQLLGKDLHHTVHRILSTCQLSTEYLDALQTSKPPLQSTPIQPLAEDKQQTRSDGMQGWWWRQSQGTADDIEQRIRNEPDVDLKTWLGENIIKAQNRLQACQPVRDEIERLSKELKETLNLQDIIWNCGWGITHFRGCLQSFRGLAVQHPHDMFTLKDRTIVFGHQTGVSFEGHIILSSEDVRHNWLDMIHSVDQFDALLQQLPYAEKALSEVLRGIVVNHRKFQPTVMIQKYIQQLGKLTSALYKHRWLHGYPDSWPRRLDQFQIVVECEAGPLMLSPTGQFIVPASCPAFLLVDFISNNILEAGKHLQQYHKMKTKESEIYVKCMSELGLAGLEKDDNVTPDLMVQCCTHLLDSATVWGRYLRDMRLRVSHYYSVLQDGEMCIPWDWKSALS